MSDENSDRISPTEYGELEDIRNDVVVADGTSAVGEEEEVGEGDTAASAEDNAVRSIETASTSNMGTDAPGALNIQVDRAARPPPLRHGSSHSRNVASLPPMALRAPSEEPETIVMSDASPIRDASAAGAGASTSTSNMEVAVPRRAAGPGNRSGKPPMVSRASYLNRTLSSGSSYINFLNPDDVRDVHINEPTENSKQKYPDNYIRTTNYTFLNFIPKNLLIQFSQVANLYFLIAMIISLIPGLSPVVPMASVLPVLFIVSVSMIREASDEYGRYRADKKANDDPVRVVRNGTVVYAPTKNVHVGEIVLLSKDEVVPADMIVLFTSSPHHDICYVETAQLDGETNLKQRRAIAYTAVHCSSLPQITTLKGKIVCEKPNKDLHKFEGQFQPAGKNDPVALTEHNLLLRGCVLRNAKFVFGLVIYTGVDTKLFQNLRQKSTKRSLQQRKMNRYVLGIFFVQQILIFLANGLFMGKHNSQVIKQFFAYDRDRADAGMFFKNYLTLFVLMNLFIPISLFVSLEVVKMLQAKFMEWDEEMVSSPSEDMADVRMLAKTSSLNEELAQIEWIFTDKTGTLTQNRMEFAECSILSMNEKLTRTLKPIQHNEFSKPGGLKALLYAEDREPLSPEQEEAIHSFLLACALCHTVVPSIDEVTGDIAYEGESSDEVALVKFAASNGYKLIRRSPYHLSVMVVGVELHFDIVAVLPFSPERKRMSMLVRQRVEAPPPTPGLDVPSPIAATLASEIPLAPTTFVNRVGRSVSKVLVQHPRQLLQFGFRTVGNFLLSPLKTLTQDDSTDNSGEEEAAADQNTADRRSRFQRAIMEDDDPNRCWDLNVYGHMRDSRHQYHKIDTPLVSGAVHLITKGADAVIWKRCMYEDDLGDDNEGEEQASPTKARSSGSGSGAEATDPVGQLQRDVSEYAGKGLRTLLFACRQFSDESYISQWLESFHMAQASLSNRKDAIERVSAQLERSLNLLGCTAVEDKLQDEVPETLEFLRQAGTTIWMITGDKRETAVNIAHSAKLIDSTMRVVTVRSSSVRRVVGELELALPEHGHPEDKGKRIALVFTGVSLDAAMKANPELLLRVCKTCAVGVLCRATPLQKSTLVNLIKTKMKAITLAIGDGANDVSMIQEANVGVGIVGREGSQATRASDYAIGEFRLLRRLLVVHGRYSYVRQSFLILFSFYKNIMLTILHYYFLFYNQYSSQLMIDSWLLALYNVAFTFLPPAVSAIFEKDLPEELVMKDPTLYKNIRGKLLTKKSVLTWIGAAVWQSGLVYFLTLYSFTSEPVFPDGRTGGLWSVGMLMMSVNVIVVLTKYALETRSWTAPITTCFLISFIGYFLVITVYNAIDILFGSSTFAGIVFKCATSPQFWLTLLCVSATAILPDVGGKYIRRALYPEVDEVAFDKYRARKKAVRVQRIKPARSAGESGKELRSPVCSERGSPGLMSSSASLTSIQIPSSS